MVIVNVSLLEVRKKPSVSSKIGIKRGTIANIIGPPVTCKHEQWIHIQTINEPVIDGYVLQKYTNKL